MHTQFNQSKDKQKLEELSREDMDEMLKRIIVSLGIGTLAVSDADKDNLLYHYTNIEALFNGIIVKEPESDRKAISLFATDSEYLNDINEIHYGNEQIDLMITDPEATEFCKNKLAKKYNDGTQHFIISFSQAKDCLPMWSMYAKNGSGIALGFDIQQLLINMAFVYPCFYHKQDVRKFMKGLYAFMDDDTHFEGKSFHFDTPMKKAYRDGYIHQQLTTLIKHPAYEYEKEVRFVCSNFQAKEIEYRCANNLIIPYTKMYLPKSALKSITIGPCLDSDRVKTSIKQYLESKGFKDVDVFNSDVPYRK